jgi:hypothetical protein
MEKIVRSNPIIGEVGSSVDFGNAELTYEQLVSLQNEAVGIVTSNLDTALSYVDDKSNAVILMADKSVLRSVQSKLATVSRREDGKPSAWDRVVYQEEDNLSLETTAGIPAGSAISIGGVAGYSYAVGVNFTANGTPYHGYLSCGHDNISVNQTVTYNGATIGTVKQSVDEGSLDYSLIARTNSNYFPSSTARDGSTKITHSGTLTSTGDTVKVFGRNGTYNGSIISLNVKWTENGQEVNDYLGYSLYVNPGDSGGAVVALKSTGNKVFVGVQSSRITLSDGRKISIGTKWSNINADGNCAALSFGD